MNMLWHDDPGEQAKTVNLVSTLQMQREGVFDRIVAKQGKSPVAGEGEVTSITAVLVALSVLSSCHWSILRFALYLGTGCRGQATPWERGPRRGRTDAQVPLFDICAPSVALRSQSLPAHHGTRHYDCGAMKYQLLQAFIAFVAIMIWVLGFHKLPNEWFAGGVFAWMGLALLVPLAIARVTERSTRTSHGTYDWILIGLFGVFLNVVTVVIAAAILGAGSMAGAGP